MEKIFIELKIKVDRDLKYILTLIIVNIYSLLTLSLYEEVSPSKPSNQVKN